MTDATPAAKKPRGCLFYAGVTAGVLLLTAALASVLLVLYLRSLVISWTDTAPTALPQVAVAQADQEALSKRVEEFRAGLDQGKETPELVLGADDINALIAARSTAANPIKDMLRVSLDGDRFEGQVSVPLDKISLPLPSGRYLNATASFNVSMENGVLLVTAESVTLKGKPLPEALMAALRRENIARDAYRRPDSAELLRKLERVRIKDGRIAIKPRRN